MSGPESGATSTFAAALAALAGTELPDSVLAVAKAITLDGFACMVAGTREEATVIAREYAEASFGSGPAAVAGGTERTGTEGAAFANGVALHCLDYEPIGSPPCHTTSSVLPALLSIADRDGLGGKDVLTAFVAGWEIECRLRKAFGKGLPGAFHPSGVYGPVAAAGACSVLLGLEAPAIEHALGIAASSAAGVIANVGSMTKAAHAGNGARVGVQTANLAARGFTSTAGIFEHRKGYMAAFCTEPVAWDALNADWGERWFMTSPGVNFKGYPVQNPMQALVDAVLDARPDGFDVGELELLEITGPKKVVGRSHPDARGHEGKFSVEYCAGAALALGDVGLDTFEEEPDPRIAEVIKRIRLVESPEDAGPTLRVRIRTTAGTETASERSAYHGSLQDPMTPEERLAKATKCFAYAGRAGDAERAIALVDGLDGLATVHPLTELLLA